MSIKNKLIWAHVVCSVLYIRVYMVQYGIPILGIKPYQELILFVCLIPYHAKGGSRIKRGREIKLF